MQTSICQIKDNTINNKRDVTLDMMKGVGIFSVVLAHFISSCRHLIYSFHMPLFFIISGILFSPRGIKETIHKDFKRLVVPYLIVCLIYLILDLLRTIVTHENIGVSILKISSNIIFPQYKPQLSSFLTLNLGGLMIWFLLALFWCKTIYNIFVNKIKTNMTIPISFILSVLAIHIDDYIDLPFSILNGMGALFFFAIGYWIKKNKNKFPCQLLISFIICTIVWLFFAIFTSKQNIELYANRYDLYPLDILIAIGGTFIVWILCKYIFYRFTIINKILVLSGRNSLLIYCLHVIDLQSFIPSVVFIEFIPGYSRIIYVGGIFLLYLFVSSFLYRIKFVRNTFGVTKWSN